MSAKLSAITRPLVEGVETVQEFIAYCARVSNPANQMNTETSERLLTYCADNGHWSVFEMASAIIEVKTTRDIARQLLRHRSFSFQEFSQRYGVVDAPLVTRKARLQDTKNRQNSLELDDDALEDWWFGAQVDLDHHAQEVYNEALNRGIAKEVARAVLPEGLTGSTLYVQGTMRSWIHYIEVRTHPSTQKEHRNLALECVWALENEFPLIRRFVQT